MDRTVVNSVVTRAFFLTTSAIRSRVHFFPSAGATSGHYPVTCDLTIFGKGIERRTVRLDGGRLNQPDGIRLEDAFPSLASETSGVCGIEVRLECSHGRINLLPSRVFIEMVSPQFVLSYVAAGFQAEETVVGAKSVVSAVTGAEAGAEASAQAGTVMVALHEKGAAASLVIVNSGDELIRPEVQHCAGGQEARLHIGTVAAESVVEFPLDETLFRHAITRETLWGSVLVEKLWMTTSAERARAEWYILYRDPVSKRPISVSAV